MKWIAASVMCVLAMTAQAPMAGAAEQYHSFMLTVDSPTDGTFTVPQWTLAGGFANGVAQLEKTLVRNTKSHAWYPHTIFREGTLTLDGKALKGQFSTYDPMLRIGTWTLEGAMDGGKAAGTWTVKFLTPKTGEEKSHSGKFTGTVTPGSEMAKSNAIANGKDWPCWSGPNHNMTATPSGQKLVDDLDQARLVWRSQQAIGLSQGHFSHPYFDHLFAQPTCGGGAAPIVADGKVFATQWFPDGKEYDAEGLKKLQDAAAQWGLKEPTPAMKLHVSKTCHDWYVCMDAATGQTLWTAEFPEEAGMYYGNSHPDHKGGPTGLTPCYANGKLFGLHLSGYLRAMDAKTGKLLWKQKVAGNVPQGRGNCNCVMFIGGVVMVVGVGGINACDPETGAILWKGGGDAVADPQRLVLDGKEYAFTKTHEGKSYSCLDPKTGKELWNLGPQPGGTLLGFTFWINGDTVAVLEGKDAKVDPVKNWQGSVSIVLYRLTPQKAEKVWEVPAPGPLEGRWASVMAQEKYVAVFSNALSSDKAWLLDRATGKEVAVTKVSGPENHGFVEVAEDRFFVKPDGVHGGIHFSMMGATPETFKVMGKEGWGPKFPHASSYAYKPTTMPIVDGRMYFRGADGIYCYDLRKTPAMLKVETALEGAKASDGAAIDKGDLQVANRSLAMIRSLKPDEAVRILGDALKGDKPW